MSNQTLVSVMFFSALHVAVEMQACKNDLNNVLYSIVAVKLRLATNISQYTCNMCGCWVLCH